MNREDRFNKFVARTDTCWLWLGYVDGQGYGRFSDGGNVGYAHRWSYRFFIGVVPIGLQLDHLCRVRHCVNPSHLEAVTAAENVRRGASTGNRGKDHCPQGHPHNTVNTYRYPNGTPKCRVCGREWVRLRRGATAAPR